MSTTGVSRASCTVVVLVAGNGFENFQNIWFIFIRDVLIMFFIRTVAPMLLLLVVAAATLDVSPSGKGH